VLYRWVEGRFLDSTLTERHLHKVGPFTARLQSHGKGDGRPSRASNAGR
jgi:Ser/Thr protein kinase RdoA (MazF antagonist)